MSEQLNRAAHVALGKCLVGMECECIPNDYCHDLNAAAELERFTIEKVGGFEYGTALLDELDEGGLHYNPNIDNAFASDIATLTAEQRTIACLKALGKMPEGV